MNENNEKYIFISKQTDLNNLIERVDKGPLIADDFKFTERSYFITFLESLGINYEKFTETYYFYDKDRHLHISESEFGYVWISTYGLIARNKTTNNRAVNACANQFTVISLLLDKAIEISNTESVYDIDSYNSGYIKELSPALFHNILFYIEVFCKAYLSLNGLKAPYTHKLSIVYESLIDTMFTKKHNDSLFQVLIADKLKIIVEHITRIPGDFKEENVKYDDNQEDSTVIIFEPESLNEMKIVIDFCHDFIMEYYYLGNKTHDLKSGLYQRLLEKAKNKDQKNKISEMYQHLISNENNPY